MSKLIYIIILCILLVGSAAIYAANSAKPVISTTIEEAQSVQIGRVWIPAEPLMLEAMREAEVLTAPQSVKIGHIWVP